MRKPDELNLGDLIQRGISLRTREVLAIVHEITRVAGNAFPHAAAGITITGTGDVSLPAGTGAAPIDPRDGVADLLEALLPADAGADRDREVPRALRSLPARLRASERGVGPRDRRDLLAMLSWHLQGEPRQTIQQLVQRAASGGDSAGDDTQSEQLSWSFDDGPASAARDLDLDLQTFGGRTEVRPYELAGGGTEVPPYVIRVVSLALAGLLCLAIGVAAYWSVRKTTPAPRAPIAAAQPVTSSDLAPSIPTATPAPAKPRRSVPLPLNVVEGAFSPTFASTGRELFFHAGRTNNGRLLVASLDDRGQLARVSTVMAEGGSNYHPRVSPDGRLIAFDSDRDGERGVYVAERDSAGAQRVSGTGYAAVPSWSPDMKYLAFVRGEANRAQVWNLWLRHLESGELQRHTSYRGGQVWGASWFPDARRLCYSHESHLVISSLDAREDIVIPSPIGGRLVRTPAVSPDGRSVIFQVVKDGVWLLDVHTKTVQRILDDPTAEEFSWAPDGRRVAYHSRRDGQWKIWLMTVSS